MLFNAPTFLFAYLPLVLAGTFLLERFAGRRASVAGLVLASLAFYGWDHPRRLLPILLLSVLFNFAVGRWIAARPTRLKLALGVGGGLAALGWFKYAGFLSGNLAALGMPVPVLHVVLPIGISFFTFTQIAYLVDAYRGHTHRYRLLDYTLFVTFFPHLVAGPILRHDAIVPQFERGSPALRADLGQLATGLSWFIAGLFKKVVLADGVAAFADPVFAAASAAAPIPGADAWLGALAYALQLYFDFSGYSDMAIGLALMLGVRFPMNFDSPYKSASLTEFWRRWHITLSRFLRDYLYIPLGGNRRGPARRLVNLFLTMLLGGLWHGAGWTFLLWGALHGAGLAINHLWRERGLAMPRLAGQALTLLFVVLAWVPFRAGTLGATTTLWAAMLDPAPSHGGGTGWAWVAALGAIALLLPNTGQIFASPPGRFAWRPSAGTAVIVGAGLAIALAGSFARPSAFLYFQF